MIILDVKNYCHDCPIFTPTKDIVFGGDNHKDVYVRCTNRVTCDVMERHLEISKMEAKNNERNKIGY